MTAPKFTTLGCRLNAYETEAMKELAAQSGVTDAVIVNTCAVTSEAAAGDSQAAPRKSGCSLDRDGMCGPDRA
jgi:threonylcarbamoyladenosine tRNA methylthiotransferase MtaB